MGLIKVMARVNLMSEEDMDNAYKNEAMGINSPSKWKWRSIALHSGDIRRLVSYNATKTIILGYDESQTLADEQFDGLMQKWQEALKQDEETAPYELEEEQLEDEQDV